MRKFTLGNLLVCLFFLNVSAQEGGIRFQYGLTWKQILAKAKKDNKCIFIDCYATWCGPCKFMDNTIFTQDEVGEYFNSHFINIKVQMDQTKNDSPEIQKWYEDAKFIESKYGVGILPTYLFFSPNGEPLHRFAGASKEGKAFVEKAREAFNSSQQYYTNLELYKNHLGDSAFLVGVLNSAIKMGDNKNISEIGNVYIDCLKAPFSKENMRMIARVTKSSSDKGFKFFLKDSGKVNAVLGPKASEYKVLGIIYNEDIQDIFQVDSPPADWDAILRKLNKKYPAYAEKAIARFKVEYCIAKHDWREYEKAVMAYMKRYGSQEEEYDLNEKAWFVFLNSNDKLVLNEALKWSKRSIENYRGGNYVNYLDTYANLLYKTGNTEDGIKWENKAIEVAESIQREDKIKVYKENIEKMKKGEKTWD